MLFDFDFSFVVVENHVGADGNGENVNVHGNRPKKQGV